MNRPSDAALDAAAQAFVDARARRDAKTPHQAALDAWRPGGPSVEDIEARIREMRGLPSVNGKGAA